MEKIYLLLVVILSTVSYGQMTLGKIDEKDISESAILDFEVTTIDSDGKSTPNTKGIILPSVTSLPSENSNNNGMFVFDETNSTVKMMENGKWRNLSDKGNSLNLYKGGIVENKSEEIGKGIVIGSDATNAEAILALEATDKALRLPRIANPHTTVKSPYPGMMCFDTVSQTLAVFDGESWNFWK